MNPIAKGTMWAVGAAATSSWLPLFYIFTHVSDDPFVWRSWLFAFQAAGLVPVLVLVPAPQPRHIGDLGLLE